MSIEEAQERTRSNPMELLRPYSGSYQEVGGGPAALPPTYHTIIDLPRKYVSFCDF